VNARSSFRLGMRTMVAGGLVLTGLAPAALADAATPCVRVGHACYPTVQAAVDAAGAGETVHIPRGRFAGGVVVTKSVDLVGAGADASSLVGGEHVLTVGEWMAATEPTVTIRGLTLRGGRAHSSPESLDFTGLPGVLAGGGGLEIPAAADFGAGATVTVIDSVITDNRSAPVQSVLPGPDQESFWPHCPDGFCSAAGANGGGVENWGTLTLVRSSVSGNVSGGPVASDSDGAGIYSWGNLTLQSSRVEGNRAVAVAPHGRFAEGAGVFMEGGTRLIVRDSSVSRNTASLSSTNPVTNPDGTTTDMLVNAGGIHVNDDSTVAITSSRIDDNTAVVDNPQGQAGVINAGLQLTVSDLTLNDSSVSGNRALARIHSLSDQGPLGGALQWCNLGTLDKLRADRNITVVTALHGNSGAAAAVFAGATVCQGFDPGPSRLTRSRIRDNVAIAIAPHGRADVFGAGIDLGSTLTMNQVDVSHNRGISRGHGGDVQGGGIWNSVFPLPFLEGLHGNLTLQHVKVTENSLTGGPGAKVSGGGIYSTDPISLHDVVLRENSPNQCTGCPTAPGATLRATRSTPASTHRLTTDPLSARLTAHP
jgi:hypothetical protein